MWASCTGQPRRGPKEQSRWSATVTGLGTRKPEGATSPLGQNGSSAPQELRNMGLVGTQSETRLPLQA